jgi:hypothetical protein
MKFCKKVVHLMVVFFVVGFWHIALGQPFYYDYRTLEDPRYAQAFRVNLSTGQEELFLPDSMRIINIWPDPSQKWVYVDIKGDFLIVDANNPSIIHRPLGSKRTGGVESARYFPKLNRFYITWIQGVDGVGSTATASFDGTTFALIDSSIDYVGSGAFWIFLC